MDGSEHCSRILLYSFFLYCIHFNTIILRFPALKQKLRPVKRISFSASYKALLFTLCYWLGLHNQSPFLPPPSPPPPPPHIPVCHLQFLLRILHQAHREIPPTRTSGSGSVAFVVPPRGPVFPLPDLISLTTVSIHSQALPPIFGTKPVKFSCSSWSAESEILSNFLWKLLLFFLKLIKENRGGFGVCVL